MNNFVTSIPAQAAARCIIETARSLNLLDAPVAVSNELAEAEKNLNRIIAMTPGKEHYAGCYLFNYGDSRPMTLDEMKFQMDLYYKFLKEKKIQGVIVCSNNIADTGLEAPEYLRQWLAEHGEEEL